jgi:hypothetical protein
VVAAVPVLHEIIPHGWSRVWLCEQRWAAPPAKIRKETHSAFLRSSPSNLLAVSILFVFTG